MTDFEKLLGQAAVRQIPPHWRGEILTEAEKHRSESARPGVLAFYLAVRGLLWPHPAAWAALAACWILTGLLCFTSPRGTALYAVTPPGVKPVEITPESYAAYLKARDSIILWQPRPEPPVFNRRDL